jgi:Helix-turn-helix
MISSVIELCAEDCEAGAEPMITGVLLGLRLHREWTQELLSAHSGISVRTIRNLESGRIRNPRRSTVDLLLAVLDPEHHHQAGLHHPGAPVGYTA